MASPLPKDVRHEIIKRMADGESPMMIKEDHNIAYGTVYAVWYADRSTDDIQSRKAKLEIAAAVRKQTDPPTHRLIITGELVAIRHMAGGTKWAVNAFGVPVFGPMRECWDAHVFDIKSQQAAA